MPVSALEKLQAWLSTYPHWDTCPANICVLPKGMEEISRQEDVLGNTQTAYRCYVTLFWEMTGQESTGENANRLLDFQSWVGEQSALGLAPHFGDIPARERIRTEKGGLTAGAQIVTYTVTLVADFMKVYEVK